MNQISNWGEAALTSVAAALALFLAAIPRVIGFLIILLVGWFIANLIAKLVASLLRRVNFNGLAERSGISGFVAGMGIQTDAAGFIALIVKWFIRLIALVVAFDALGLPAVSEVLRTFLLWIPNLVVGVLVLVIGGLLANAWWPRRWRSTARWRTSTPSSAARWNPASRSPTSRTGLTQAPASSRASRRCPACA